MEESSRFTRCLLELPRFTVNDVRRLARLCTETPKSKLEKGFKFYVSSYLCNYEGKNRVTNEISVRAHCYRSMKKAEKPHQLRVGLVVTIKGSLSEHFGKCILEVRFYYKTTLNYVAVPDSPLLRVWHVRTVVPPVLSCTETEQKWHKPRTMGVKPGPVDAMVVVKPKPGATSEGGIRSQVAESLALTHCCLNPILYASAGSSFKQHMMGLAKSCGKKGRRKKTRGNPAEEEGMEMTLNSHSASEETNTFSV